MSERAEVVIVGGGVIGCAIAYALAKQKVKPLLLERDTLCSGATYASAGMLAPLSDTVHEPLLMELGMESFALYPSFIQEVEEASGFSIEHQTTPILRVASDAAGEQALRDQASFAAERGLEVRWLSSDDARKIEPTLAPDLRGATISCDESQVNPPRLVEALRRAALNLGARFREHTPAIGLVSHGGRVRGVKAPGEAIACDKVVLASGAWSCFSSDWLGFEIPTYPVRGQVVIVDGLDRPLRHIVMRDDSYAVPRMDGTTLVGCTREEAGFAQHATVAGVTSVLTAIQDLIPSMAKATINHTRAGLRPGIAGGLPALGPAPGMEDVILAAGHNRSGVLLAPVTAAKIACVITQGPEQADLGPFNANRLGASTR